MMKKKMFLFSYLLIVSLILNTHCTEGTAYSKESEDFNKFFASFSTDSVFQKSRIKFPLEYLMLDIEGNTEKIELKDSEWEFIDFEQDKEAKNMRYDAFKPKIEVQGDEALYIRQGIDNGINIEYLFKKFSSGWFLTKIVDKSA